MTEHRTARHRRAAEVLASIDAALDVGHQDTVDEAPTARPDGCVRCSATEVADDSSGFCEPCRAYMLGDSPIDPARAAQVEQLAEAAAARADLRAQALAAGDMFTGRLLDYVEDLDGQFATKLASGEVSILVDGGRLVTGQAAVDLVLATAGR